MKQFFHARILTLQTDHHPFIYTFADEESSNTASATITRWELRLTGFDFELNYTPGKQIPHANYLPENKKKSNMEFVNTIGTRRMDSSNKKAALIIQTGINFRGVVPFISPKLRYLALTKAHATHPGENHQKNQS